MTGIAEDQLNHLTPTEAFDILQRDSRALFIDVRSNMEFLFVGVHRVAQRVAQAAERGKVPVADVRPGQRCLQVVLVELGIVPGPRDGPNVDELLDAMRLEQADELLDGAIGKPRWPTFDLQARFPLPWGVSGEVAPDTRVPAPPRSPTLAVGSFRLRAYPRTL